MRIAHPLSILLLTVTVASVSACNGMRTVGNSVLPGQPFGKGEKVVCKQDDKLYAGAREMPTLKAPDGLETPDTRNALKVPQLSTPERMRGREDPCLDAPPAFATTKSAAPTPNPVPPPAKPREVPTE